VLGIALAAAILAAAPLFLPAELLPSVIELGVDGRVVTFCVAMTCLVGVLFGLAPAWQATGLSLVQALMSEGRTATGRGSQFGTCWRPRRWLQPCSYSAAPVCYCGRCWPSIAQIRATGPRGESVLTLDFVLPGNRYATADSRRQFYDGVEREVEAVPAFEAQGGRARCRLAGRSSAVSRSRSSENPPAPDGNRSSADFQIVSHTTSARSISDRCGPGVHG
jgi:putative ABC transport system permease protein